MVRSARLQAIAPSVALFVVLVFAAGSLVACGGSAPNTVARTVAPATSAATAAPTVQPTATPAVTSSGVDEVDRISRALVGGDDVTLAALTGYSHLPCTSKPVSPARIGDPPPCKPDQADGTVVEALPVTSCGQAWAQPIDAVGAYRVALSGRGTSLAAAYVPAAAASPFGAAYREQYVVVARVEMGGGGFREVAMHIFGGRIVWVETACPADADLAAASRARSYLVAPAAPQ